MLDQWCLECSSNDDASAIAPTLSWRYIGGHGNDLQQHALTSTDSQQNPWYRVFTHAIADLGMTVDTQVFPAATDSRFLRALGIRALGFSPMRSMAILLHENDEYFVHYRANVSPRNCSLFSPNSSIGITRPGSE